jgi:nicotinate-nucleotide pyrophosphorylase (carboxylating)
MTAERLAKVAATGVNYISMGALTHSAPAVDIHLRLLHPQIAPITAD